MRTTSLDTRALVNSWRTQDISDELLMLCQVIPLRPSVRGTRRRTGRSTIGLWWNILSDDHSLVGMPFRSDSSNLCVPPAGEHYNLRLPAKEKCNFVRAFISRSIGRARDKPINHYTWKLDKNFIVA